MSYDLTKGAYLGDVKALALKVKAAITAAVATLPAEMFLDTVNTRFVDKFTFSTQTYPGATNPNLDGKPVLVFAIKSVNNSDPTSITTSYHFLSLLTLADTYSVKSNSTNVLNISGYEIEFKIDPANNNAITVTANGIKVDISGKADKVANAVAGNLAGLDANGNPTDSGIAASNVMTTDKMATSAETAEMLAEVFGA